MSSSQHLYSPTTSSFLSAGYFMPPIAGPSNWHATTNNTTTAGSCASKTYSRHEHITFEDGVAIDATLHEIPQKPYSGGIGSEPDVAMRIDYRPYGFTVGKVLSGDCGEISDPNGVVDGEDGAPWPEKPSFHLECCDPAFGAAFRKQQRIKKGPEHCPTKATFAVFAADGIQKMLEERGFARFPCSLNEIRVVSIDVRSKGTLQPRIFVDYFAIASEQPDASLWIEEAVRAWNLKLN